jgi:hypothetical protein
MVNSTDKEMPSPAIARKIVRMYFQIVLRTVLTGFEWKFPHGYSLSVRKYRKVGAHGISQRRRDDFGMKQIVYNLRRPNEIYSIVFRSKTTKDVRYNFDACDSFRKKLTQILFSTDTVYSYKGAL